MARQITLNLYDDNDEIIRTVSRSAEKLKFGFVKRAVKLRSKIESLKSSDPSDMFELVSDFLIAFFGNEITLQDIEDHATPEEVFAVLQEIVGCAEALTGPENFQ